MSTLPFVDAQEVDRLLTFPALIDALRAAFAADWVAPVRHHHEIEGKNGGHATLLLMPAWSAEAPRGGFVGTKIVSVFGENAERGEPSIYGTYLLMDGRSGRPVLAIDGTRLTAWRTAAASALAASYLAREDARRMVMVGAGALAPFLIRAHAAIRPLDEIVLWNRSRPRADAVIAELAAQGLSVRFADDLEAAVRQADIVSCATLSKAPLVHGAWLKPGAHLDLVGAYNLEMREADDEALARAHVFVDTPAALFEGGDVAVAIRAGAYGQEEVAGTLADLCTGRAPGRTAAEAITLFKSVGASLEDIAAAELVHRLR